MLNDVNIEFLHYIKLNIFMQLDNKINWRERIKNKNNYIKNRQNNILHNKNNQQIKILKIKKLNNLIHHLIKFYKRKK